MATSALTKKLGLKPRHTALVLNAPAGYRKALDPLPEGATVVTSPGGPKADLVQVFVHGKADVDRYAPVAVQAAKPNGLLWFAYPKKSSTIKTDISRDTGWEGLAKLGLRGVSLIAIDDTWSCMRFRLERDVKSQRKQ